jgi:WD40-like Beta Propeller Repeat
MLRSTTIFLLFAAGAMAEGLATQQGGPDSARSSDGGERLVVVVPDGIDLAGPPITDPDGKRVENVSEVVFRDDGGQVAYVGFKGGRSCPVIGATVFEAFDYLSTPFFGGSHVFFRAGNRTTPTTEKWWIHVDGKKTAEEDWIGAIACNADGSQLAYWTQPGAKIERDGAYSRTNLVLVVGKLRGARWADGESLTPPVFGPDGSRVATAAMKGNKWFVLVAGGKGEEPRGQGHGAISGVAWRPDGKEIACAAVISDPKGTRPAASGVSPLGMKFVIVSGKEVFGSKADAAGSPVFSPDGKRIAFKVLRGTKLGIAVSNAEKVEPQYDFVGRPVFNPAGTEIAYAANTGGRCDPTTAVLEGDDASVEGGQWFVVRGTGKSEVFEEVRKPVYSPDGARLAYAARIAGKWHVVVDKSRSPPFDAVDRPRFTPDGKRVCFGARLGRELWWKVMAVE